MKKRFISLGIKLSIISNFKISCASKNEQTADDP